MSQTSKQSLKEKFKKTVSSISELTSEASDYVKERVDKEKLSEALNSLGDAAKKTAS